MLFTLTIKMQKNMLVLGFFYIHFHLYRRSLKKKNTAAMISNKAGEIKTHNIFLSGSFFLNT